MILFSAGMFCSLGLILIRDATFPEIPSIPEINSRKQITMKKFWKVHGSDMANGFHCDYNAHNSYSLEIKKDWHSIKYS